MTYRCISINIMERKQAPHGRNSRCIEPREEGEKERDTQAFHKQSVPEHTCHPCPQSQLKVRWQACSDLSNHFPAMLLKPTSVYKSQPHTHTHTHTLYKYRICVQKLKSQCAKQKKSQITWLSDKRGNVLHCFISARSAEALLVFSKISICSS